MRVMDIVKMKKKSEVQKQHDSKKKSTPNFEFYGKFGNFFVVIN